jgi:hypothetical protein
MPAARAINVLLRSQKLDQPGSRRDAGVVCAMLVIITDCRRNTCWRKLEETMQGKRRS